MKPLRSLLLGLAAITLLLLTLQSSLAALPSNDDFFMWNAMDGEPSPYEDSINTAYNFHDGNSPDSNTGINGDGLDFESSNNDYIGAVDSSYYTWTGGTIGCWVNPESNGFRGIFTYQVEDSGAINWNNENFVIYTNADGDPRFTYNEGDSACEIFVADADPLSTGSWHLIVAVVDVANNNGSLWVDGAKQGTASDGDCESGLPGSRYTSLGSIHTSSYFDGIIDECFASNETTLDIPAMWNGGAGEFYPFSGGTPNGTTNTHTITLIDRYDDSNPEGVNISLSNATHTLYNLTDASGTANFYNLSGTWTPGLNTSLYYNNLTGTIGPNETMTIGVWEAQYHNTTIVQLITGANITGSYNLTTSGGKTYNHTETIYLQAGQNNLTFEKSAYYDKNFTVTATLLENSTATLGNITDGVYNSLLTITATEKVLGGSINTFSINATNTTYSYESTENTTTGTITLAAIQGIALQVFIDATGYVYANATIPITNTTPYHSFELYITNTFIISIYDETNNSLITGHPFKLEFISDAYATNSTYTNQTHYEELLVPGSYEIRYYEIDTNGTYTTKRTYFVDLTNRSYETIKLYAIPYDISGYYTPIVLDSSGYYASGVIVKAYRGYIEDETLAGHVVEMSRSDPNGQAVFRIEPNNVFYKFTGTKGDESFETNYFKITQDTHTFQLSEGTLLRGTTLANSAPYNLSFNTETDTFRLSWDDSTNSISEACLTIKKYSTAGEETVSDSCVSSASGSIAYTVTDTDETKYIATSKLTSGEDTLTDIHTHNYNESYQIWGLLGIFLTLIVFLFAVSMAETAEGVAVNGGLSIVFMSLIGIFAVEWTAIVGILIIAGVIVYKTRS